MIDIHSHLGDYPSPAIAAHEDGNEMTDPTTPEVWAEHRRLAAGSGFTRALANGGVTTLQILPGSANLMGGRSVTLKNVPARTGAGDEVPRRALFAEDGLRREPQAGLRRAEAVPPIDPHGQLRAQPRRAWLDAQEDMRTATARRATSAMKTLRRRARRRDPGPEPLLPRRRDGRSCSIWPRRWATMVTAFHHAVESYKIADLLREAGVCSRRLGRLVRLQDGSLRRRFPRTPR